MIKGSDQVGEIVKSNHKTAKIFTAMGIDFCCSGGKTLEQSCLDMNIPLEVAEDKLRSALEDESLPIDYDSLDSDLLIDFIVKKHHRYVKNTLPVLIPYLNKVARVHGRNHPELHEVRDVFLGLCDRMIEHMDEEEKVVFPVLSDPDSENRNVITRMIEKLRAEHDQEGEVLKHITQITENFNPPEDACNTYSVTFGMLKEFVEDLYMHIHAENNILFQRIMSSN